MPWCAPSAGILLLKRVQIKKSDSFERAKNYAFLLLKFRPRSQVEISYRLKKKKFSEAIIKETTSFLKDKGFIDDDYFARAWIESRLKRPFGFKRIKQELKLKGLKAETIDKEIDSAKTNYCEQDIVAKLAKQRLANLKHIEPQKAKQRVYAYLLRRGFSPDVIMDAIWTNSTYEVEEGCGL